MAGVEPASERAFPRISTSVVDCEFHRSVYRRQKNSPVSRWDPRASLSRR